MYLQWWAALQFRLSANLQVLQLLQPHAEQAFFSPPPALRQLRALAVHGALAKLHLQPSDRVTWLERRGRISSIRVQPASLRGCPFARFLQPSLRFCAARMRGVVSDATVTPRESA